jgi:terminase small subunit / prophage DNA-packing protein
MSTQEEVAEHLNLSARRVRDLIKEGLIPGSRGHGGLDLDACRISYINYLRGLASGRVETTRETLQLDQERAMLTVEQRKKLTRENALAEKTVAPLTLLHDALVEIGTKIAAQLEALPLEMKRANPRLTGHDIMIVKKCLFRCRDAISETKLDSAG